MIVTRKALLATVGAMVAATVVGSGIYISQLPFNANRDQMRQVFIVGLGYALAPSVIMGGIVLRAASARTDRQRLARSIAQQYLSQPAVRDGLAPSTVLDLDVFFAGGDRHGQR